jgi:hypothetical protein
MPELDNCELSTVNCQLWALDLLAGSAGIEEIIDEWLERPRDARFIDLDLFHPISLLNRHLILEPIGSRR